MSDHLIWFVGNRNPSITETLTYADGTVVDLTGSTVKLKMRAVGSSTLKVNASATIVGAATLGAVRYDWAALDVDTAGDYLVWWEVTTGGKTQDLNEAVIEFRAHAPQALTYVEIEEFKSTAELSGTNFADGDIRLALTAASRGIDYALNRRFYLDADANQVRYYTPGSGSDVPIDDLAVLTKVEIAPDATGSFFQTLTQGTDFFLEPLNAAADVIPYYRLRLTPATRYYWPPYPNSIKVTGQFGWATVPPAIQQLTSMIAARLVKRTREAPFGVIALGADAAVSRASAYASDPDYVFLTAGYRKPVV